MHDTPSKSFFKRDMRALSHGCVRLADPRKMAAPCSNTTVDDDRSEIADRPEPRREGAAENPGLCRLLHGLAEQGWRGANISTTSMAATPMRREGFRWPRPRSRGAELRSAFGPRTSFGIAEEGGRSSRLFIWLSATAAARRRDRSPRSIHQRARASQLPAMRVITRVRRRVSRRATSE